MRDVKSEFKKHLKEVSLQNLKNNWFFPISSGAFLCLNFNGSKTGAVAMVVAFVASCLIAARSKPLISFFRENRKLAIFSMINSVGISIALLDSFTFRWLRSEKFSNLLSKYDFLTPIFHVGRIACAVISIIFIAAFSMLFWKKVISFVRRNDFLSITKKEIAVYACLFLMTCIYVVYAYSNSVAFYDTHRFGFVYDAIYTSDSTDLFQPSAYVYLAHTENDLRQPLFALFAAPLLGFSYLISFPFSVTIRAIIIDCTQIGIMLIANYLIAKSLKIKTPYRICYMLISCSMYSYLLFSLMMEQYIVTYFWLAVLIYTYCIPSMNDDFPILGAGGTLLTSFVALPFLPNINPIKNPKSWFRQMCRVASKFLILLIVFCKFDVIINLFSRAKFLVGFTGKNISFMDRVFQFSEFIKNCFIAPNANALLKDNQ